MDSAHVGGERLTQLFLRVFMVFYGVATIYLLVVNQSPFTWILGPMVAVLVTLSLRAGPPPWMFGGTVVFITTTGLQRSSKR